jgi:hypothetical protein
VTSFERLSLVAAFTAIAVNVIVFVAFVWQLRYLGKQVRDASTATQLDHDRRRKQATIEFYTDLLTMRAALSDHVPYDRDAAAVAELLTRAANGDDIATRAILEHLSLYELFAAGVRTDVFDFSVAWRTAGNRIVAIMDNYRPWIDERRVILGQPGLYYELEWLAKEVSKYDAHHDPRDPSE